MSYMSIYHTRGYQGGEVEERNKTWEGNEYFDTWVLRSRIKTYGKVVFPSPMFYRNNEQTIWEAPSYYFATYNALEADLDVGLEMGVKTRMGLDLVSDPIPTTDNELPDIKKLILSMERNGRMRNRPVENLFDGNAGDVTDLTQFILENGWEPLRIDIPIPIFMGVQDTKNDPYILEKNGSKFRCSRFEIGDGVFHTTYYREDQDKNITTKIVIEKYYEVLVPTWSVLQNVFNIT